MARFNDLKDKVIIVTGGASGIGRGICEEMVRVGAKVIIADIEEKPAQKTAQEIGASYEIVDVSSEVSVAAMAQAVMDKFGRVDILVNNAGIGPICPISELKHSDWEWMINVNLWGVINGLQVFLPILRNNPNGGHIVNTASMAGIMPAPTLTPYNATKFGVVAITESLALENKMYNLNVGASVLCPGPVKSNINNSYRNRPKNLEAGGMKDINIEDSGIFDETGVPWVDAGAVGKMVIDAIINEDLYIITHPHMYEPLAARHRLIEEAAKKRG